MKSKKGDNDMKKNYLKPDAEYIKFYSEEEMTNDPSAGAGASGSVDDGTADDGWID